MKRHSIVLVIRKMPIKTTTNYHYWQKKKRLILTIAIVGKDMEEWELSYVAGGNINYPSTLEN